MTQQALVVTFALAVAACGPNSNMVQQPKYQDGQAADIFDNGAVEQTPPDGVVARGSADYQAAVAERPPMTRDLVARGQERYAIYCAPCHGATGAGNGTVVERGFPRPPDFDDQRLRDAPTGYFVKVATDGVGVMYPQGSRVSPADRWAIEAYIRALQLSRHVAASTLPNDLKDALP